MKRLLLPLLAALALPTAVNAFPWDKKDEVIIDEDIIIKTDLDEEYIVKDSTVTITPWSKLDAIKAAQKNHPIDKCLKKGLERGFCFQDLFSKRVASHVEAEDALIAADISTPMNIIKFRPIFVDLNGNKTANTYFNIACINPKYNSYQNIVPIYKALNYSICKLEAEKYLKLKDELLEFNDIKVSTIKKEDRLKILAGGNTDKPLKLLIKRKGKELKFFINREKRY